MRADAIHGCLLGGALGDAVGLRREGVTRRRAGRLYPSEPAPDLCCGRGFVSDDTEHALLTALALMDAGYESEKFGRCLATRLRRWLWALPPGIGLATLRATLKLSLGVPASRSGVRSAGNGPAMRAAILGVMAGHDLIRLRQLIAASTRITHTDSRAEQGAMAVALAASSAAQGQSVSAKEYLDLFATALPEADAEWFRRFKLLQESLSVTAYAERLGAVDGVSGFVLDTVPVAICAWLCHPHDFRAGISATVHCGGDTDTVAAIAGGIIGAGVGPRGLPTDWLQRICWWPYSTEVIDQIADALAAEANDPRGPRYFTSLLHNAGLTTVVLALGLRRLLPPY